MDSYFQAIATLGTSVPSEDVATKVAAEYLLENGNITEDAYLSDRETLYLKTINTSTDKSRG